MLSQEYFQGLSNTFRIPNSISLIHIIKNIGKNAERYITNFRSITIPPWYEPNYQKTNLVHMLAEEYL